MTLITSPVPEPTRGAVAPAITREIYGMPTFVTLLVTDVDASVSWYTDGLGFISLFTVPGPGGAPALVHLRRWQFQDILIRPAPNSPEPNPVVSGSSMTLSFAAVYDEIEGLADRARAHGGGIVEGPRDTRWNTRDLVTTDPDGNTVIFTAGRPADVADEGFSRQMGEWNRKQGLPGHGGDTDAG
jgi:catechol 2,3-dioxygenase-like lactoylglutathione lyase family enzyme